MLGACVVEREKNQEFKLNMLSLKYLLDFQVEMLNEQPETQAWGLGGSGLEILV